MLSLKPLKKNCNHNLNRNKQAELDTLVANLKSNKILASNQLQLTQGSLDEMKLLPTLKTDQKLITRMKKSCLRLSRRKILTFQQDKKSCHWRCQRWIVPPTLGNISVTTENGKETENAPESKVTKEAVNQVKEIGTPVTMSATKKWVAPCCRCQTTCCGLQLPLWTDASA